MKSAAVLLALGASVAMAQDINSLPECARTCIENMQRIAIEDFGCNTGDISCVCQQPRYGYGVRDCSFENCGNEDNAMQALQFANTYCSAFQPTGTAAGSGALPIITSAMNQPPESTEEASGTGGVVSSVTQSVASSVQSEVSSAASGVTSAVSSVQSDLSSVQSSINSEASSAIESILSSASSAAESAASSATGDQASQTGEPTGTETESGNFAPRQTGAALPLAAGAGLAAWLLL